MRRRNCRAPLGQKASLERPPSSRPEPSRRRSRDRAARLSRRPEMSRSPARGHPQTARRWSIDRAGCACRVGRPVKALAHGGAPSADLSIRCRRRAAPSPPRSLRNTSHPDQPVPAPVGIDGSRRAGSTRAVASSSPRSFALDTIGPAESGEINAAALRAYARLPCRSLRWPVQQAQDRA